MAVIHWKNQVAGSFNTAALWAGGVVPDGSSDAALDAAGSTNYTVTSSVANTVNSIRTAATATLSITANEFTATNGTGTGANAGTIAVGNNATLALGGTVKNSGKISLTSTGNNTVLSLLSDTTLSGGGTLVLNNNTNNFVVGGSTATTLTNVDNTISGAGQLGNGTLAIANQAAGVIKSVGSNALTINTGAAHLANAGLLEGASVGGLTLQGVTVDNTGTIEALNGDKVQLSGATINGGILTSTGTGAIMSATNDRSSVLNGVASAVTNNGVFKITNNAWLTVQGTITDNGSIQLNSSNNDTRMVVGLGGATLSGGNLVMTDNGGNSITGVLSGPRNAKVVSTLTNDGTIKGSGNIGFDNVDPNQGDLALVNDRVISANGHNALVIATGNALAAGSNVVLNDGTLQSVNSNSATTEGGLILSGVIVNNDGTKGQLLASGLHTHIDLDSTTVEGGFLRTANGGVIDANDRGSVLDGTTNAVTIGGSVNINNNQFLTVEGAIKSGTTQGVLTVGSTNNDTRLIIATANATLTGLNVNLTDNGNNSIVGVVSGPVGHRVDSKLTNASVIQGSGTIGPHLVINNQSTIDATGGAALTITSDGQNVAADKLTNAGLLESTNPSHLGGVGGLILNGITVANTLGKGVIEANGLHTHVDLVSATIAGGTLITAAGGVIDAADRGSVLDGTGDAVNNQGTVTINNNQYLTIEGAINNTGTLAVSSTNNDTTLVVAGSTLSGKGQLTMSDNAANRITGTSPTATLTNVDNTISGAGQLGGGSLRLVNQASGVINATGSANALFINLGTAQLTNSGLIEASGGAGLEIQSSIVNGSTGGTIMANDGSHVNLRSATLIGGTLSAAGAGFIQTVDTGSVLDGTKSSVNNTGQLDINNNTALTLQGTLNNTGTLSLQSTGNVTDLVVDVTGGTLSGGGLITLSNNAGNRIYGVTPGSTLTNADNVIDGAGEIGASDGGAGLTLVNQAAGLIEASGSTQLLINTGLGGVTNSGTLAAGDGVSEGVLNIAGSIIDNGTTGQLLVHDGSTVNFASSTIEGGTLKTLGLGTGSFQTSDTQSVFDGQTNAVNIAATLNILNNTALTLQGTINNTASGLIALNSSGNNTDLIVDVTNVTLKGGGQVEMTDNPNNRIYGATGAATLTNVDNTISGAGQLGAGQMTLVNQTKGVIDGNGANNLTIDTGANIITNGGTIEADGTVVINSAIANAGTLKVISGLMQLNGAVTGAGKITVGDGTLEIGNANAAEAVKFTTTAGVLQLDHSVTYTGAISGFTTSTGTTLDLRDIGFNSSNTHATYVDNGSKTGGVLTVTDGTNTAHIKLTGNYTQSTFDVAADGHNGTLVTDPSSNAQHHAVAQFTQALAGFSPTASGHAGSATTTPSATTPVLVMPRAA